MDSKNNTKQSSESPRQIQIVYSQEVEVKAGLLKLWKLIPLFIKFLTVPTLIIYILNLFIPIISFIFANIPSYTISRFQLWRLITSVFITTNIFNVILGTLFWIRDAASLETSLGTIKYMLIFFRNSFFIQVFYSLLISLISLMTRNIKLMEAKMKNGWVKNCGFWPIIMCEITLLCLCNPNTYVQFLFIPWKFQAKYYPIIWIILFCLVNNINNDLEVFIGVLYALLFQFYFKKYLNISDSFVEKLENNIAFKWMKTMSGFVSVSHITNNIQKRNASKSGMNFASTKDNNSDINKSTVSVASIGVVERDVNIPTDYNLPTEKNNVNEVNVSKDAPVALDQ